MLALARQLPEAHITWVLLAASEERAAEAQASADDFLAGFERSDLQVHGFRDGFLPYVGADVKQVFEGLKAIEPDLVFTHARYDLHQDHRLACELTWNTFRDHLVLEYEVPKYDGDLGTPNVFVPLSEELVDEKLRLLSAHHGSQHAKHWFDDELFRGLLRIRGMESGIRYAEAFTCRKLVLAV